MTVKNGQLPKGWREMQLGEVCSIDGRTLSSKTPEDYCFDYIALSDIDRGHLLQTKHYKFSEAPSRARRIVKKGDVLLATVRPNLQGFYVFKDKIEDCVVSTGFAVLSPQPDLLDSVYLFQILFSHRMLATYYAVNVGSNYPAINSSDISKFKIPIPSLSEQKAIASLLEKWDTAIEKTEALIEAKEKRFKWLITRLIAQSCKHWNHYKANELFKNISCKGYPDEELLSVTQDRGVIPRKMLEGRVMSPTSETNSYKLVEPGNFAISLRSFQGGLEYSKYRGIISPAYTVLLPKKKINDDFYRHFFKTYIFVEKYLAMAVIGIRDGKQINFEAFKSIKLPFPSLPEQQRIAQTLNTAQQEINLLKQLAEQYCTQKRGLMQKLLTGQWRVSNQ